MRVFVFGGTHVQPRDAITRLPLELAWKLFSYLDDGSLRNATFANKTWRNIIVANKKLRSRLNHFELSFKLGSDKMARFCRRNRKLMRKSMKKKNFIPVSQSTEVSTTKITSVCKRGGDDLVICTKRFKLF